MRTSLVICSRNGGERLKACLGYVSKLLDTEDFELVLVDNGSTDGVSFPFMQSYAAQSRFPCKVVQTLRPGNSAGRNDAVAAADGELLLFIDDDCYPTPTFVRDWREAFAQKDVGYGSGRIMKFRPDQSALGCQESLDEADLRPRRFMNRGVIQGSNMAFSRACLAAAGPFDEDFGAGTPFAGEEWELALRASRAGWRGGYFPKPTVSHDHGRFEEEAATRLEYYDYGAGAVYAKFVVSRPGPRLMKAIVDDWRRTPTGGRQAMIKGAQAYLFGRAKRVQQ